MQSGTKNYYLIHGDPLLMQVCQDDLIKNLSGDTKPSRRRIEGKEVEDELLINLFRARGLGGKRIILLSNPTSSQKELITKALDTISKNKSLYFIITSSSVEKNAKFYKAFNKAGQSIECVSPINEYGKFNSDAVEFAESWINDRVKDLEIEFESNSLTSILLGRCRYNVGLMTTELEKLRLYYKSVSRPISAYDIEVLIPDTSDVSIFSLISSLEGNNFNKSLSILNSLIREREVSPELIFHNLLIKSRTWILMKKYMELGYYDATSIRDAIKQDAASYGQEGINPPHPFVLKIACNVAKLKKMDQLVEIYRFLGDAQLLGRKGSLSNEQRYQLLLEFLFLFYSLQSRSILVK